MGYEFIAKGKSYQKEYIEWGFLYHESVGGKRIVFWVESHIWVLVSASSGWQRLSGVFCVFCAHCGSGSGSIGFGFLFPRGVLSFFFFSISCLLDRRVRACWKDAPEVQWIVQRGLPVFSVYCTRRLGFGYDKTAMF